MQIVADVWVPLILVLGFLFGLRLLQSPSTAILGNRIGACCMLVAIVFACLRYGIHKNPPAIGILLVGGGAGIALAQKVKTIQMPQLVALLNGCGGAASALVVAALANVFSAETGRFVWLVSALALGIGALTFSGSLVAMLKLQGQLPSKPMFLSTQKTMMLLLLVVQGILIVLCPLVQHVALLYILVGTALVFGSLMAVRVGGADMPVIISFLNSLSGVAAAVSGMALDNALAVGVGAIVGVAGMILTQLMCRSMNRSLAAVLSGFHVYECSTEVPAELTSSDTIPKEKPEKLFNRDSIPQLLQQAQKVIIVPGYGMALAQAQQAVKDLMDELEKRGKEVKVAVHPVAGRMPGHMHVLLAEVGVDYDKLFDMAKINHEFEGTDVVIVVGACDVMNPAATTAEGTPIYGMPILNVAQAKAVIVCNYDEKPGYSGVPNSLYGRPHVITIWGDAAETIPSITRALTDVS